MMKFIKSWFVAALVNIPVLIVINVIFIEYGLQIYEVFGFVTLVVKYVFRYGCQFCVVQFSYLVSILYEKHVLGGRDNRWAVKLLLWRDKEIDDRIKGIINGYIFNNYGIKMLSGIDEYINKKAAKSVAVFVVSQIENSVKDCEDVKLVKEKYDAAKMMIGSSFSATIVSVSISAYSFFAGDPFLFVLSVTLLLLYSVILSLNIYFVKHFAREYAFTLLEQFMFMAGAKKNIDQGGKSK